MIFSYSTNAFVHHTASQAIEMIADAGFAGAELMCDRPHAYPPDMDDAAVSSLKNTLEQNGVTLTNLNCFTLFAIGDTYLPSWIESEPEKRRTRIDHTIACLKLAHDLGCACISIPPGGPPTAMDRRASLSLFYKGLEAVIPTAQAFDITLLIEPEPGLLIENSRQMLSALKDIASDHVGINFDVGHFFCVGEKPEIAFDALFEAVGHIHIEDIAETRIHEHLIPGLGAIDFDTFFKTLRVSGYEGDVCLELYPYIEAPKEAGIQGYQYLKPVMERYGFK